MKNTKYFLAILAFASLLSCEKAITFYQDDERYVLSEKALESESDAQELVNSVYDVEANFLGGQLQNFSELLGDPLSDPTGRNDDYTQVWNRRTDFFNGSIGGVYRDAYIAIYRANSLLERVDDVPGVTAAFSERVKAEAHFIRGLNHFLIARLFAQPYNPNTDNSHLGIIVKENTSYEPQPRNTVAETYAFIIRELHQARANLPEENSIYATSWAAKAMLAKVYLEMANFDSAYYYANDVIANGGFQLDDLDRFENGTSLERIFGVVSTPSINDRRGSGFRDNYRTDQPTQPTLQVSATFYNYLAADTSDTRFKTWFTVANPGASNQYYGTSKFNFDFLDVPVIHLTEMILIKAECLYEQNDYTGAVTELNKLRLRAGMNDYGTLSPTETYAAVQLERALELCFEGDRLFQLKRQAVLGRVLKIRGVDYDCNGMVLQFPNSEGTGSGFVFNPSGGCN